MKRFAADDIERAHLRDPADRSFEIHRVEAPATLSGWLSRYWIPVWEVPSGEVSRQEVLQHPVCIAVTTPEYSRLAGPTRGLSVTELRGRGWAFGLLFTPAAGARLLGGSPRRIVDGWVDLEEIELCRGVTEGLRTIMASDPASESAHTEGRRVWEERLGELGELDEESRLTNEVVRQVTDDPQLRSVTRLAERTGLGVRALERLCARRIGVTPLWLIRRRRLHEAVAELRSPTSLAQLAADLGYSDQAHFSRDVRSVTGMTPRQIARRFENASQQQTDPEARAP